jgi:hypothetical protein
MDDVRNVRDRDQGIACPVKAASALGCSGLSFGATRLGLVVVRTSRLIHQCGNLLWLHEKPPALFSENKLQPHKIGGPFKVPLCCESRKQARAVHFLLSQNAIANMIENRSKKGIDPVKQRRSAFQDVFVKANALPTHGRARLVTVYAHGLGKSKQPDPRA